ncbi:MAG TPA: HlyD family secretion protein [Acidocella sp.]|nr:HlyD family secretion protein [Acidocella sp.]
MSDLSKSNRATRWLIGLGGGVVAVAVAAWLIQYLLVGQYFVSTDDAYIAADSSMIAAKVSGYVTDVAVKQDQRVTRGQLLVRIDPRDYENALALAQADTATARARIANDQAQLALQQANIAGAQAKIQGDQAQLTYAVQNQRRYARLSATGASPIQTTDLATTDLATARARLAADQAGLTGAHRQMSVLNADLAQAQANLKLAEVRAQQAALNLSHTDIRAPFDGVVGDKTVALGDYLQPGTQIMAIVPLSEVYILANYKETQITNIRPGEPVDVDVDAFPNLKVTGWVDSVFPDSGQEFALLPPDNATGNFTKIVQRVPVKIYLHLTPELIGKLRPGLSVEPSINTRARG